MSPLVSCIVPVFNGERYLGETIESVLAQTHRPIEIIVVDDGSTDRSAAVASTFGASVKLLRQTNRGVVVARAAGMAAASGSFVAHLDADDLWLPEKLERQLARFEARPELEVSITHFRNFWVAELAGEAARYAGHPLSGPQLAYSIGTVLARRSCFEGTNGFDVREPMGDDTRWFVRAQERGAVIEMLPEVLMRRRFHATNLTRTQLDDYLKVFMHVVKTRLDSQRRRGGPDTTPE